MSAPAPRLASAKVYAGYADTEVAIDEIIRILMNLRSLKDFLKEIDRNIGWNFYDGIKEIAKKFKMDIANHTGDLLHDLLGDVPGKETLKKLIHEFPSSLEYEYYDNINSVYDGRFPIHSAVRKSVECIPLLAEQGVKYNIGGDFGRGGLLVDDPTDSDNLNVLQLLVNLEDSNNPVPSDFTYLNTMQDLRDMNLLVKDDISDQNLLFYACSSTSKLRFEYLADWSQDGLKTYKCEGLPIFHSIILYSPYRDAFPIFLEASLQRHPHDAGLLFQKDQHGRTTCECAFDKFGKEETLNILQDLIPPDAPQFPILHHVAKHIPQYMDDFASRYTSSIYTRDMFGYTVSQVESQGIEGTHMYRENGTRMIDPDMIAGLYPFMVAASGNTRHHLSAVYCLIRREPSLVHGGKRIDNDRNISSKRKRRRDEDVTKQD